MSAAARAVAEAAGATAPATLAEVVAAAGLQTRVDRKYLVTAADLAALGPALSDLRVLQIEGRRSFGYESVYFDTEDLALFRAHRQGRRRRWKVRTRTYLDSGECLVEVKTKGRRGETVKSRRAYRPDRRQHLDPDATRFLTETLVAQYGTRPPPLVPTVTTSYRRTTFADLEGGSRVTCDVDLSCARDGRSISGPDRVLVESKSTGTSAFDRAVARLGLRPVSISKYCLGAALTRPDLAANRWHRLLTREFGWERLPGPAG